MTLVSVVAVFVCGTGIAICGLAPPGRPPPAVPAAEHVDAAEQVAAERDGIVSFAVIDTRGDVHCHRCRERHSTASVVKAMLLVAYLRRTEELSAEERRLLSQMIVISSNAAADEIHRRLGDGPLVGLAEASAMEGFRVRGYWGNAETTALDQARLFERLDELVPERHLDFAREQLSSVERGRWGLAETARPEWETYFKGGWTPSRRGELAHQAGRLERDGSSVAVAILTDGSPTQAYGRESVRLVADALLGED